MCPRCGAMTPLQARRVYGEVSNKSGSSINLSQAEYPIQTAAYGGIVVVECGGCGGDIVVLHIYPFEVVWPLPALNVDEALPPHVAEAYKDAMLALSAGSKIGALMAGRTVLFRLLRDQKSTSFKDLVDRHVLTPALYGGADQLRLWADIIGHEDISVENFKAEEVGDVLEYLGIVLEAVYVLQAKVDKFAARTQELKKGSGG